MPYYAFCRANTGIAVQNNDETIREISSAGGAIGAILSMVFEKNGVAFCVGMNEDNIPMFYEVHSMRECREHRVFSSKYVSSIIGNTYQAVKENLDRGGKQLVCFIGLPCQSAHWEPGLDWDKCGNRREYHHWR